MAKRTYTAEEVKQRFRARGQTIAEWAKQHGYPEMEVYRVISGQYKCHRGRAHRIAVDLGLKAAPERLVS